MGGGDYTADVSRSSSSNMRRFEAPVEPEKEVYELHPDLNVKNKDRECRDSADHRGPDGQGAQVRHAGCDEDGVADRASQRRVFAGRCEHRTDSLALASLWH